MTNPTGRGLPRTIRRMWQPWELEYLDTHYATTPTADIARHLNRSLPSVKMMNVKRGLLKAPDYTPAGRIQTGQTPWNKGLKGWSPEGSEKTRFGPGHLPATAAAFAYYDGQVVAKRHKDGSHYQFRRISSGVWRLSHQYNWEQLHGPIPKGYVLRCRTTDTLNDDPANWELLSRNEHAARNRVGVADNAAARLTTAYVVGTLSKGKPELRPLIHQYPDLIQAQRLRLTLNRTIQHVLEAKN